MSALFYPAAVWLDSIPLTDQGRSPVEVTREEKFIENELASAKKMRYFQSVKERWSLSWTFLPENEEETFDGYAGRKTMREVLGNRGKDHLLRFYDKNSDYQEYIVFCDSYQESLIRRDPVSGIFLWEISVEFCES
jgi:hypothetical protein